MPNQEIVTVLTIDDSGVQQAADRVAGASQQIVDSQAAAIESTAKLGAAARDAGTATSRELVPNIGGSVRAFDNLRRSLDPGYDAWIKWTSAARNADAALRAGVPKEDVTRTLVAFEDSLKDTGVATEQMAEVSSYELRSLSRHMMELGREATTGDFSRFPLTATLIATRLGSLGLAGTGAVAGIAALFAAFASGAVSLEHQNRILLDYDTILKAVGNTAGLTAEGIERWVKAEAAAGTATQAELEQATKLVISHRELQPIWQRLVTTAEDWARVTGQKVPEATQALVTALTSGGEGAIGLINKFGLLDGASEQTRQKITEQIREWDKLGKQGDILALMFPMLEEKLRGLHDNITPTQKAWADLGTAWSEVKEAFQSSEILGVVTGTLNAMAEAARTVSTAIKEVKSIFGAETMPAAVPATGPMPFAAAPVTIPGTFGPSQQDYERAVEADRRATEQMKIHWEDVAGAVTIVLALITGNFPAAIGTAAYIIFRHMDAIRAGWESMFSGMDGPMGQFFERFAKFNDDMLAKFKASLTLMNTDASAALGMGGAAGFGNEAGTAWQTPGMGGAAGATSPPGQSAQPGALSGALNWMRNQVMRLPGMPQYLTQPGGGDAGLAQARDLVNDLVKLTSASDQFTQSLRQQVAQLKIQSENVGADKARILELTLAEEAHRAGVEKGTAGLRAQAVEYQKRIIEQTQLQEQNRQAIAAYEKIDKAQDDLVKGVDDEIARNASLLSAKKQSEEAYQIEIAFLDIIGKLRKANVDLEGREIPLTIDQVQWANKMADALGHQRLAMNQLNAEQKIGQRVIADMRDLSKSLMQGFEDAIVAGKDLGDVFTELGQDIERLLLRRFIEQPFVTGLFGTGVGGDYGLIGAGMMSLFGAFGGGAGGAEIMMQGGGHLRAGQAAWVGESGPERFVPDVPGTIVPNHALGGTTIVVHQGDIVAPGATPDMMGRLQAMQRASEQRVLAAIPALIAQGGPMARAVGRR